MAKKEEDQWYEAFGYLSPEEQDAVMAEMGYSPQQSLPFAYEGSGLSDYYPLGDIAATPEFTSKGNLDPYDLTQQAKRINVAQDYGSLLLDNILSGIAGPGSYDMGAFTPETEYGKEVTLPGRTRLESYAGRGGWEGYLANEIMKGGTPSSALASLQQFLENTDPEDKSLSDQERTAYQSLVNSLPKSQATGRTPSEKESQGFWGDYDYETLYKTANEYSDAVFNDPGYGYSETDESGVTRYWDKAPEEIKTPQMEFFDKYGLPYPTASYEDPKYLQAMLDAEEGTTQEQRDTETAGYLRGYEDIVGKRERAENTYRQQGEFDDAMLAAWEANQPKPLATRPGVTTVPGSAGVELGRERRASPNAPGAATIMGTSEQAMLPTTVLQPGRELANPQWGTNPRTGIGAGNTWNYTNDQGQKFATPPDRPINDLRVRTLANGLMGLIGSGVEPQPGMNQGFGILAPGELAESPDFNIFRNPKGSKTREMKASDVDRKARTQRAVKQNDAAVAARQAQRDAEAADPRLNDIKAAAMLHYMGLRGRTPLGDAVAQRRAGAARMGL